ncbi:MAG: HIT family protein [Candidatus Binataceae bacterium]
MARRRTGNRNQAESETGLERLWAPWRNTYLKTVDRPGKKCIFCFGRLSRKSRRSKLILYAGPLAQVMLNRYPYNNGHLMIAPRRHIASPELMTPEERAVLAELTAFATKAIRRVYNPAGINLGANLGRAAGAGFAEHAHWHLVPRWEGDTNFMPVLARTRVLSEMLEETFLLLDPLFTAVELPVS